MVTISEKLVKKNLHFIKKLFSILPYNIYGYNVRKVGNFATFYVTSPYGE
jgi:hypothetical protein